MSRCTYGHIYIAPTRGDVAEIWTFPASKILVNEALNDNDDLKLVNGLRSGDWSRSGPSGERMFNGIVQPSPHHAYMAAFALAIVGFFLFGLPRTALVTGFVGLIASALFASWFLGWWWFGEQMGAPPPAVVRTLDAGAYLSLIGFVGLAASGALAFHRPKPAPPIDEVFR